MKQLAVVALAIAGLLTACTGGLPLSTAPAPDYMARADAVIDGRLNPWKADFLLWRDRGPEGEAAFLHIDDAIQAMKAAQGQRRNYAQITPRDCYNPRTMTLSFLIGDHSYGPGEKTTAEFVALIHSIKPEYDRLIERENVLRKSPLPKATSPLAAQAIRRLALSRVFDPKPYTPDWRQTMLDQAKRIEQCQIDTDNAVWLERMLPAAGLIDTRSHPDGVQSTFELLRRAPDGWSLRRRWLPSFASAAMTHEIDPVDYARATDELAIVDGVSQPFASIFGCGGLDGATPIGPAADLATVAVNRVKFGLPGYAAARQAKMHGCDLPTPD